MTTTTTTTATTTTTTTTTTTVTTATTRSSFEYFGKFTTTVRTKGAKAAAYNTPLPPVVVDGHWDLNVTTTELALVAKRLDNSLDDVSIEITIVPAGNETQIVVSSLEFRPSLY